MAGSTDSTDSVETTGTSSQQDNTNKTPSARSRSRFDRFVKSLRGSFQGGTGPDDLNTGKSSSSSSSSSTSGGKGRDSNPDRTDTEPTGPSNPNGPFVRVRNFIDARNESRKEKQRDKETSSPIYQKLEEIQKGQESYFIQQNIRYESDRKDNAEWRSSVLKLLEEATFSPNGNSGRKGKSGNSTLSTAAAAIAGSGIKALGNVVGTVTKAGSLFARIMGSTGTILVRIASGIGRLGTGLGAAVGGLSKILPRLLGGAGALGSGILSGASRIGGILATGAGAGAGILGTGASAISRTVLKAVPLVGTALATGDLLGQIDRDSNQKADTKGIGIGGIANAALSGGSLGAAAGSVVPGVGTAVGGVAGAAIGGGLSAVMQHRQYLTDLLGPGLANVRHNFSMAGKVAETAFEGIASQLQKDVIPKIREMWSGMAASWRDVQPVMAAGRTALSSFTDSITSWLGEMLSSIRSLPGTLSGMVAGLLPDGVKNALASAPSAVSDGVSSLLRSVSPVSSAYGDTRQFGTEKVAILHNDTTNHSQPEESTIPERTVPSVSGLSGILPGSSGSISGGRLDEDRYLSLLASVESGGDASAKNPRSSATGLWQLTAGTVKGLNRSYGTSFTMEGLKDPRQAYQAERLLLAEERRSIGRDADDPERLAALHVLGLPEYNRRVRGRVDWKESLSLDARSGDRAARDALRDVGLIGSSYADRSVSGVDIESVRNGTYVSRPSRLASVSPAYERQDSSGREIVSALRSMLEQDRSNHAQAMKVYSAGQQRSTGDVRGFDWNLIPTSVAAHDIQTLLSKPI